MPTVATRDDLASEIERWMIALAAGNTAEAEGIFPHGARRTASEQIMECALALYGRNTWSLTDPREVVESGGGLRIHELDKRDLEGRRVLTAHYRLPINGEWSAIEATFVARGNEAGMEVTLADISIP